MATYANVKEALCSMSKRGPFYSDTPLLKRKLLERKLTAGEQKIAELETELALRNRQLQELGLALKSLRLLFADTGRGDVTIEIANDQITTWRF